MRLLGILFIQTTLTTLSALPSLPSLGNLLDRTDPFTDGPHSVHFATIKPELFGELDYHLDVFTPNSPGKFPVILFFPGLGCSVPAHAYSTVLSRVASWGYTIIGPWSRVKNPLVTYKAQWVDDVIHWAKTNLNQEDVKDSLGIHTEMNFDFDTIYLGAQSSGAHVAVEYLKISEDCTPIKAMFLMSPVDGVDPYGILQEYCITPGTCLNFETPTLILAGGLDSLPGMDNMGGMWPPCAPEDLANSRFYSALTGPVIMINTTAYGHMDCVDDDMLDMMETFHICKSDPGSDKDGYRQYVAGVVVSFLKFLGEGACDLGGCLEESRAGIDATFVSKGAVSDRCGEAGCSWQEGPLR